MQVAGFPILSICSGNPLGSISTLRSLEPHPGVILRVCAVDLVKIHIGSYIDIRNFRHWISVCVRTVFDVEICSLSISPCRSRDSLFSLRSLDTLRPPKERPYIILWIIAFRPGFLIIGDSYIILACRVV